MGSTSSWSVDRMDVCKHVNAKHMFTISRATDYCAPSEQGITILRTCCSTISAYGFLSTCPGFEAICADPGNCFQSIQCHTEVSIARPGAGGHKKTRETRGHAAILDFAQSAESASEKDNPLKVHVPGTARYVPCRLQLPRFCNAAQRQAGKCWG